MQTVEVKIYKFNELSEETQASVIENMYSLNIDGEWWSESVIEDATTIGALMGIEIDKIYFSGFSSQGDGACFEGHYQYKKGSVKAVKDHAPLDIELHRIAAALQAIQKPNFYGLSANIKQSGHYMHAYCTTIDVNEYDDYAAAADTDEQLCEVLRDFMNWIYRSLEKEYEYQTSEEAIREGIEANEYDFTADGELY